MRHIAFTILFFFSTFFLYGCDQSGTKQEQTTSNNEQIEEINEIKYKKYEEYTYDEFSSLPHDVQYSIKFPNDVDTIITVDYGWLDTVFTEDGTPLKIEKGSRTCNLVLEKDTLKLYYPYLAKPNLSFYTNDKIFDKNTNDFSNYFSFDFKYNKKEKYYYLLKTEFPKGITFEHELFTLNKPSIHHLSPIEKKYQKMTKELYSVDFLYSFSESYYYEDRFDKYIKRWACEENEITKFENWLNRN